jgi:hypothetical protein
MSEQRKYVTGVEMVRRLAEVLNLDAGAITGIEIAAHIKDAPHVRVFFHPFHGDAAECFQVIRPCD